MPASLRDTTIRHYQILEELGRGGMGVVYRARDTRLKRDVALKFLPPHLTADEETTERFAREAQAAASIDHPNICTIFEISETDDGQTFIAMGYYGGATLREAMETGEWTVENGGTERIVSVASQILEGLSAAHKAGIVHRDIKPGNVILADDGRVRILDFGLAKLASGVDITKDGATSGTAAYMSPEQVNGETVDHRSDLWSLGVVLYEMIAGRRPFQGEYDQATSYAIVNKEPEPIRTAAPDTPDALAEAVERALKKDPSERYQSADEFIEALSPLVARADVPVSLLELSKKPKVAIPLAAVVILLAVLGWRWYEGQAELRWAREEALPEIERLANERERGASFRIAVEAQEFLEGDPTFERAFDYVSTYAWFKSEPPGAVVHWKRYGEGDEAWALVGKTPIDSVPFPQEVVHLRLELEGHDAVERLVFSGGKDDDPIILDSVGTIPANAVRLPGGAPNIRIVGIDHMEPQEFQTVLIDKFEVTNADFKAFVDAGGYDHAEYWDDLPSPFDEHVGKFVDRSGRRGPATWEAGTFEGGQDDYPVTGVSWYEAMAYAKFAGKSLPTVYHWNAAAWTAIAYIVVPKSNLPGEGPAAVGSYPSLGRFGTYDLAGNAREWIFNPTQDGARYILGGGWNDPAYAFNDVYAQDPFDRSLTNGFRTIEYLDDEPNLDALQAQIDRPFRDFTAEQPVSDAEFESILRTYEYDRTPLNAEIEERDETPADWIREKISFDAAYGDERVIAYLYLPRTGEPPYQTIVYFPGSNAIHAQEFVDLPVPIADFLLLDGRAFLHPILKGTYERGDDLDSDYPEETVFYKDHVAMWAKDISRSIDYLETRGDIDTGSLAYYGVSWGGAMGPIMTTVEPRFKASVLVVAGLLFQTTLPESEALNFVPRVKTPTLMLNGRYDHYFPVETSQKPLFDLLTLADDQKRMVVSDLGHTVTREQLMREMFAWLDRWLDPRGR